MGLRYRGARTLELYEWVQSAFNRTLPQMRGGDRQPLAYTGVKPGESRASSSTGMALVRQMNRAGIHGGDLQAKSLHKWRPDFTIRFHGDLAEAAHIYGGRPANVRFALGYENDGIEPRTGRVRIVDANEVVVAAVPAHQFNEVDAKPRPINLARHKHLREAPAPLCTHPVWALVSDVALTSANTARQ